MGHHGVDETLKRLLKRTNVDETAEQFVNNRTEFGTIFLNQYCPAQSNLEYHRTVCLPKSSQVNSSQTCGLMASLFDGASVNVGCSYKIRLHAATFCKLLSVSTSQILEFL